MKKFTKLFIAILFVVFSGVLEIASSQPILAVCRTYVANKNCYKCSDYFSVRSQDEAEERCSQMGYDETNYFPSVGAIAAWKLGNCTCGFGH
jgi:hypothetical protein